MPLQQIAVLSPKNLMELNNDIEKQATERQTSLADDDGTRTQSKDSPDTNEQNEAVNGSDGSLDSGQAEAAPVETCVKIKSDAVSVDSSEERSDTNTDSSGDSQVNRKVETAALVTERTDDNGQAVAQARRSGKRSKKEKPSPVKKKETQETLHADSPKPPATERCDSNLSTMSMDVCRICQCDTCEIQYDSPIVSPCLCSGSLKNVHQACLQKWIKSSDKMKCELCMFEYHLTKKTKPVWEWEKLDMTPAERRKVVCSVTFHVIAITCVIWSLYVLIDRTTEEVEAGSLLWPFWTKLIVVAIGFTGGVVFMYVQCKMYLTLCRKWRTYNKVIIVESISESEREVVNQAGLIKLREKEKQLGIEPSGTDFEMFSVVNETV